MWQNIYTETRPACDCLNSMYGVAAHESVRLAADFCDRLIMQQQQQEGSSLLAQHLLPAQERVQQQPPVSYGIPALLLLLLGKDTAEAADEQPEELPHAVEMHLRERRAALEQKKMQQTEAQQDTGQKQQQRLEPDAGQVPAHDVLASAAAAGTGLAALSEPAVVQHAERHDHQPSPLQPAARASGVFARARRDKRHNAAGTQVLAGTQPAQEQVGYAAPVTCYVVGPRLGGAVVGSGHPYTCTHMTCRLEGTSTSS